MKSHIIILATAVALMLAAPALAAQKSINHDIDLNGINHIEISHSVGSVRIQRTTEATMAEIEHITEAAVSHLEHTPEITKSQLTGTIKGNSKGWFRGKTDITDINFHISNRGDTLYIVFDHDHAEADFVLTIPALTTLTIKLGVGNLVAELEDTITKIKIGVGNADLTAALASMGSILMTTDVGDTQVTGTDQQTKTRAIVTSKVQAYGEGQNSLETNVGVGNASLKLTSK